MVCLPVRGTSATSCAIKNVGTDPRISPNIYCPFGERALHNLKRGWKVPPILYHQITQINFLPTCWGGLRWGIHSPSQPLTKGKEVGADAFISPDSSLGKISILI